MSESNTNNNTNSNGKKASGPNSGPNKNNRRRRPNNKSNRNRNRNNDKNAQAASGQSNNSGSKPNQKNANSSNKRPSSNNKRRRYNNKRRTNNKVQKLTGLDYITTKYLNLLDQHLQARKKYFDNFDRVSPKQLEKLEKNFVESQKAFLVFKERLNSEDRELFEKRYESLELDTTYSRNHELPQEATPVELSEEEIVDPHLLQSQIESAYAEDNEESVGSYEDYKAYKGL